MSKLTELAKGKDCMVRLPLVCNGNPKTVTLAHYRLATGGALKPDDMQGAWACFDCHNLVDGRTKSEHQREIVRLAHAEGVFRTQQEIRKLKKDGVIK